MKGLKELEEENGTSNSTKIYYNDGNVGIGNYESGELLLEGYKW